MSGLSRIPKLIYGSKRSAKTSGIPSRESTPVQCHDDRDTVKPAPSSTVGRSKSLKLPRKQYVGGVLGSTSASKLEAGRQHRGTNGTLKEKDSSSSPDSSRASSPGNAMATNHVNFTSSTEVSGTDSDLTKSSSDNPFARRRAQSFGPNLRRAANNRHLRPPGNWSRETTPTPRGGTPTPRSVTPSSLPVPSSRRLGRRGGLGGGSGTVTPTGHRHLRSRSSLGASGNGAAATEGDPAHSQLARKPVGMRRVDSNDVIDGGSAGGVVRGGARKREVQTMGHSRGRRPNSYIMNEPADLNQLAREITSSMDEEGTSLHSPEIKSVARIHSTTTTTTRSKDSTANSGKVGVASAGHTPSLSGYGRGNLSSSKRSTSSEKLTAPLGRGTKFNFSSTKSTPPDSGGRIRSGSQRGSLNSRSSTPSSGRSTPVGAGSTGERRTVRNSPPGESSTPAGGLSRLSGPRLAQRKVIRVREARPVGINELEGAVLMDSDEYLKISHEVKALKTAILKLKRELQSGEQQGSGGSHVTETGSAHSSSSGKTPRRPGGQVADGDRIKTLETEKAKAVEENEELKKKLKTVSQKVEAVTSDLKRSEEEKKKIDERLQETETHRDLLLDKVERLHADKHKLEDRLRSLEKAQLYEESSSGWVEGGGEGGEGKWEESLMLGEGKTESDVGLTESLAAALAGSFPQESSDPESSAVCSATSHS